MDTAKAYDGYFARFARPDEADAVYAFYKDADRRGSVYLRNEELIRSQVQKGLFFTVWKDNEIHCASTVYSLADGKRINCVVGKDGRVIVSASVAELGSVLNTSREHPDAKGDYPKEFFHPLLFAAPLMKAFLAAGQEMTVDLVVANVQPQLRGNIRLLTSQPTPEAPHKWHPIDAGPQLLEAFGETTHDIAAKKEKLYFRADISNLPSVAKYLVDVAKRGYMVNPKGERLGIDMTALPLAAYDAVAHNSALFNAFHENGSLSEARRWFAPYMPYRDEVNVSFGTGKSVAALREMMVSPGARDVLAVPAAANSNVAVIESPSRSLILMGGAFFEKFGR